VARRSYFGGADQEVFRRIAIVTKDKSVMVKSAVTKTTAMIDPAWPNPSLPLYDAEDDRQADDSDAEWTHEKPKEPHKNRG
jgi:hypothetical protein